MTTVEAQIPELLLQEVRELASQQNASVDQIVSVALAVGGQRNSAGLVGVVEGNDRGLMVGNLGRADHDRTGWVACCGRGIKVERNKQR